MNEVKLTTSQAEKLEAILESHMYYLSCEIHGLDDEIPEDWQPFAPYCGCQTCDSREYIMSITKFLKDEGLVDIYVEDKDNGYENTLFD